MPYLTAGSPTSPVVVVASGAVPRLDRTASNWLRLQRMTDGWGRPSAVSGTSNCAR